MTSKTYNKSILARQQNIKGLFFRKMLEMIRNNPKICFLTSDALMENGILRKAMMEFPDRIIDVGIAEQNLVGIASGLALAGKIPFVSAMAPFLPLRALEQIHTDIAYNDVSVKLISVSSGTVSGGGPSHNLICDFGVLCSIPNITVLSPCDMNQFIKMIELVVDYSKPVYIRMPQQEWEQIYSPESTVCIGQANILKDGNDGVIIATGRCVASSMEAAKKLEKENIFVRVIDMHTIKPLDKNAIVQAAKTKKIVIVEDHNLVGGLGTMVSSVIAETGITCNIVKLGIPDEFSIIGKGRDIASYYGFDSDAIVNAFS